MLRIVSKRSLVKSLFFYFLPLALLSLVGGFFGHMARTALLIWHYSQLFRLSDWLIKQRKYYPPEGQGIWEHIFEGIYRLQQRNRRKRNELGDVVRRFREGAEAVPDGIITLQEDFIVWCNKEVIGLLVTVANRSGQRLDNLIVCQILSIIFMLAIMSSR